MNIKMFITTTGVQFIAEVIKSTAQTYTIKNPLLTINGEEGLNIIPMFEPELVSENEFTLNGKQLLVSPVDIKQNVKDHCIQYWKSLNMI